MTKIFTKKAEPKLNSFLPVLHLTKIFTKKAKPKLNSFLSVLHLTKIFIKKANYKLIIENYFLATLFYNFHELIPLSVKGNFVGLFQKKSKQPGG